MVYVQVRDPSEVNVPVRRVVCLDVAHNNIRRVADDDQVWPPTTQRVGPVKPTQVPESETKIVVNEMHPSTTLRAKAQTLVCIAYLFATIGAGYGGDVKQGGARQHSSHEAPFGGLAHSHQPLPWPSIVPGPWMVMLWPPSG